MGNATETLAETDHPTTRRLTCRDLLSLGLPEKPAYASPCNHCGLCCTLQLCQAAQMAMPEAKAPCPALLIEDSVEPPHHKVALCGMVVTEATMTGRNDIAKALGIGCGCSMMDDGTTEAEIDEFERLSYAKVYGDNEPAQAAPHPTGNDD